ncbi:MAG: hypothetical protein JNJ45_05375 [Chthonomonas sp.]|nr:hypothetical protein [Chthonomonas sp.]
MRSNYVVTLDECEKSLRKDFVCQYCGGKLSAIETVDNAGNPTHWAGCKACCRLTTGVLKHCYDAAKEITGEHEVYGRVGELAFALMRYRNMLIDEANLNYPSMFSGYEDRLDLAEREGRKSAIEEMFPEHNQWGFESA